MKTRFVREASKQARFQPQVRVARRVTLIAGLLLLTLLIGTVGFSAIEHYSWFDAFYMTLITITTVGYQELHPLSGAGRIFNSLLILFGVSSMFFSVGAVTQTIIELELQLGYGERKRRRMVRKLDGHFIVCGFGRVGRAAASELKRSDVPYLIVDRNQDRIDRALASNMPAVVADATRDDSLLEAGVMRAKGLVAALPSDAENLFIILSAKTLNPKLTVVTRVSEENNEEKLRRAGADTVFAPYSMAGYRLAQALVKPHVMQFLDFAGTSIGLNVVMEQIRVERGSAFASKSVRDVTSRRDLGVIILGLQKADSQVIFNPDLEQEISAGDFLIVLGETGALKDLAKLLSPAR